MPFEKSLLSHYIFWMVLTIYLIFYLSEGSERIPEYFPRNSSNPRRTKNYYTRLRRQHVPIYTSVEDITKKVILPNFTLNMASERYKKNTLNPKSSTKLLNNDRFKRFLKLKHKVLKRLGQVDSNLCLPKAICGVKSAENRAKFTSWSQIPELYVVQPGSIIYEYMQLLDSILSPSKVNVKTNQNEGVTTEVESSSSSEEISNKIPLDDFYDEEEYSDSKARSSESEEFYIPTDDRDLAYNSIKEKIRIEALMDDLNDQYTISNKKVYHTSPNWWDNVPGIQIEPLERIQIPKFKGFHYYIKKFFKFILSLIPIISLSYKSSWDPFRHDPFFYHVYDHRSYSPSSHGLFKRLHNPLVDRKNKAVSKRSVTKNNAPKTTILKEIAVSLYKYKTALSVGNHFYNPEKCDLIFNGCPLSHKKILYRLNQPAFNDSHGTETFGGVQDHIVNDVSAISNTEGIEPPKTNEEKSSNEIEDGPMETAAQNISKVKLVVKDKRKNLLNRERASHKIGKKVWRRKKNSRIRHTIYAA